MRAQLRRRLSFTINKSFIFVFPSGIMCFVYINEIKNTFPICFFCLLFLVGVDEAIFDLDFLFYFIVIIYKYYQLTVK